MTARKRLKAQVRARMARTGERYAVARSHVVSAAGPATPGGSAESVEAEPATTGGGPVVDEGYRLTGGTDPDAAALAHLLAHHQVVGPTGPLTEPLLFAVSGGLGAGYILWEFAHDDSRHVTLGFSHSWNYLGRRLHAALSRLGIDADWHETGGARGAAQRLRAELDGGSPCIVWPDRGVAGYWQLPDWLDGHGGHAVVAYALRDGRVHVDDRTLAPLTIDAERLDEARGRVGSYRNALLALRSQAVELPADRLRTALRDGLAATVEYLGGSSASFALPAWRKWSRLLTDGSNPKGWPVVFADGRALPGALLSVWEGVEPAGMTGGSLRGLFADALDEAAALLPELGLEAQAQTWREIAGSWHELAEIAVPAAGPVAARLRELTATVTAAVVEGDDAEAERAGAAAELWRLRAEHSSGLPDGGDPAERFAAMAARLQEIHLAERDAVGRLRELLQR